MIYGLGVDVMHISQLQNIVKQNGYNDPFFKRSFTAKEQEQSLGKSDPLRSFANRFSGKEAVYKAINHGNFGFVPREIEILDTVSGVPTVFLHGKTASGLENQLPELFIFLSLSNDCGVVMASAVAEKKSKK